MRVLSEEYGISSGRSEDELNSFGGSTYVVERYDDDTEDKLDEDEDAMVDSSGTGDDGINGNNGYIAIFCSTTFSNTSHCKSGQVSVNYQTLAYVLLKHKDPTST